MLPNFSIEKRLQKKCYRINAGVDEVGRGSFAGPVVAGCVVFNQKLKIKDLILYGIQINDSKKLSPARRKKADKWIRENSLAWGVGLASVSQINKLGIKKATEIAFRKAIRSCGVEINYLLIDAFFIPYVRGLRRKNQKAITKGDTKSISIAAASIVAKVYRDEIMTELDSRPLYKNYLWGKNKGYGTAEHRNAIKKYGTTKFHRKLFVKSWLKNSSSSQAR